MSHGARIDVALGTSDISDGILERKAVACQHGHPCAVWDNSSEGQA